MHFQIIISYHLKVSLFYTEYEIRCDEIGATKRRQPYAGIYIKQTDIPKVLCGGQSVYERLEDVTISDEEIRSEVRLFIESCNEPITWRGLKPHPVSDDKMNESHTYEVRYSEPLYVCPINGTIHIIAGLREKLPSRFSDLWEYSTYSPPKFRVHKPVKNQIAELGREGYYRKMVEVMDSKGYGKCDFVSRMWPKGKIYKTEVKRAVARHLRRKKVTKAEQSFFATMFGASILRAK